MELWLTMEKLWNYEKKSWYYTENYGALLKIMVLHENNGTSMYEGKHEVYYQKLWIFDYNGENYGHIPKPLKFLNKYM